MAYTTINKSTDYFNTKLYTGTGSENAISGIGHQPDWVWLKSRSQVKNHFLQDAVRGITYQLRSNTTAAQNNYSQYVKSIQSDGFTLGTDADINNNGSTYVAWNWKAGGGQGSSNTAGSINTTYTSVNTTAGFSICQWSGTSSAATIGHGLGAVPKLIICKDTNDTYNWGVYHASLGATKYLYLNTTGAQATSTALWNDTTPTSTVFSVGNAGASNASGTNNMIAYCFAEKTGYSKFGSYTGNGNADGTFVYTGFKPSFVIFKRATTSGASWCIIDTVRQPNNTNTLEFPAANLDAAETTGNYQKDFLSNGFKIRSATDNFNKSGDTYIYIAFGQSIVGTNNIAATAR